MGNRIETYKFLSPEGDLADFPFSISEAVLLKGYEAMWTARLVDERMITLQRQGVITFAMSSLGEEAAAVATAAALSIDDWIYPQYREVGAIFYRGFSIQDYIHHMFGNQNDLSLGRQMPN
ncbi:MAG: thiamine pyrophosphate-dependent enzyme, partial [Parachlamydiaceae bacterium]